VPDTLTPVAIFEQWAKEAPHATALIAADATLTYAELNERANRLANALLSKGLRKGDIVSLILHRDSRVLVSMLGIIKAGGAFLPIDPDYPQDRISHYINDSNARFSITDNPGAYPNGVDVDELISCENAANPNVAITPDDLCYVIYTSGSTGVPKGVMLRHGGLATYLSAASQTPHALACAKHKARLLSVSTISFDAFVLDTFSMLLNGLSLVLANDEEAKTPIPFAKLYQKTGANALMFTSARLQEYLQYPELREVFASAKIIEQGGEKFPAGLYEKIRKISQADIINMYGPTEATIASNEQQLSSGSIITVGAPIGGTVEQVMDIDGHPLPIGAVGELWIGGKGVAAGYWNRPELNAVRFAERDGVRYYKSGDLAKWTPGGEVIILGRNDGQIKLRGLRIELGEIENTLAAAPEIKQCVIKVRKLNGQDHLCAWYTAEREISADELHDRLAKTLTAYMVPTAYMQLQEMPHTPNGKIDAKALPDPQFISQHEYVAPASPAEAIFCKMFAGILQLSRVSAIDDFFTLGGTSLQVAQITVDAQKNSYEISYGDVFANPTPRALALLAQSKARSAKDTTANSEVDSYDYTKVNKLLQANTLEAFRSGQQRPLGNVLLTGATGFLGIHILREYLTAYEGNIYCLVRNRKLVSAEQRLRNMLFFYFSETFAEYFGKRLFVVDGDVTSEEDFAKLNDTPIDTVINCAANVKHFSHGTDIEDINIGGVQKGVDFCKRKGCRYIQISTTSVAGDSINGAPSPDIKIDEQMLYFGQDTANKYVHSKFLAERIVLEAASEGLDAKVMRAGNLMARNADGEFQINFNTNNFIGQLKANHVIGKIAYRDLEQPTEITPIDTTASAMLQLAQTPRACCLFHPYNTHLVLLADVIHVMNERGLRVEACEQEEFRKAFAQTAQDAAKAKYLSPLIAYNTASDDTVIPIAAQNKYTLQVLLRLGFQWPLVEDGYLVKFIENLHGLGFFDVPATSPA
jgi:amino acid adenylation domain-containing protein/thioester reductase-like protein